MTNKRVVFTMGGKGGVGKTGVMVALAEWFSANGIPVTLLDLDTENKARGSFKHFFEEAVTKVNIHTPAGLDAFVDHLDGGAEIILADMGAGAGQVAADWFESMHEDVAATGVRFTAVGVVTPDPASVESVLAWASRLQDRVDYVIVENATSSLAVLLAAHAESSERAKEELLRYADKIASRITALPREIEAGLKPEAISKQLGESLRQQFAETGIKDTALALHQTSGALQQIQKILSSSYVGISESHRRTVSHVESANSSLIYAMESRLKTLDALVHEFKSDLLQIWLPVVVGAALMMGLLCGMAFQSRKDNQQAAPQVSIPVQRGP